MPDLDPSRELPAGHEPLDLPPGHRGPGWSWLLAAVLASLTTFSLTGIFLAIGFDIYSIIVVTPILFIFTLFLVHAVAERAR